MLIGFNNYVTFLNKYYKTLKVILLSNKRVLAVFDIF